MFWEAIRKGWISYCMYKPYFIYPFLCQWTFGLLPLLTIVNNYFIEINIWDSAVSTAVYIPRYGLSRSCDESVFNFWGSNILFPQGLRHLYSQQQRRVVQISPHCANSCCVLSCFVDNKHLMRSQMFWFEFP